MKKVSEYRDEDALDLLADIMEPALDIFSDAEVRTAFENERLIKVVRVAIKNHKHSVIEIMARLEGVPLEEYHCNILTLPLRLLDVINDQELLAFFTGQAQSESLRAASGPAMEIIEGTAED